MHRSETANELMEDIRKEHNPDILLISEQYRYGKEKEGLFYEYEYKTAAISVPKPEMLPVTAHGGGRGFVWIRSGDITYFSCYHTPSVNTDQHRTALGELEDAI